MKKYDFIGKNNVAGGDACNGRKEYEHKKSRSRCFASLNFPITALAGPPAEQDLCRKIVV